MPRANVHTNDKISACPHNPEIGCHHAFIAERLQPLIRMTHGNIHEECAECAYGNPDPLADFPDDPLRDVS